MIDPLKSRTNQFHSFENFTIRAFDYTSSIFSAFYFMELISLAIPRSSIIKSSANARRDNHDLIFPLKSIHHLRPLN